MIVECNNCEALVNGTKVAEWHDEDPEVPFQVLYTVLKCPKCTGPLLVSQSDLDGPDEKPYRLYPPQRGQLNPAIPRQIREAYEEAASCQKAKAHTAAAIMCRKTLEGICREHGVEEMTLMVSLRKMRDDGIIENRLYEWADALRIVGNEAAHDVKVRVSPEDAKDVLEFTNALLEYTFTFRDKFEKFKERRGKSPAP